MIDGEEVVDDAILEGVTLPFLEAAWLKGSGLVISEEGVGDITLLRRFLPNLTLEALRPEPLDLMRISGLARFKESAAIFDLHLTKAGADLSKIEEGLRRLVRIRVNDREQGVHDEPGSDH